MKTAYLVGAALVVAVLSRFACDDPEKARIERMAEVEHIQWIEWSKTVAPEVSPERRERWKKYWVPYDQLPDDVKELDRAWARRSLKAARLSD